MYAFRDLVKQRTRTILGISGITISIFLLTAVGMLGDSISYSYIDYASQSVGKIDYIISGGRLDWQTMEQEILTDSYLNENIGDVLPRSFSSTGWIFSRTVVNLDGNLYLKQDVTHIGVQIDRENRAYQGKFIDVNTGEPFSQNLTYDECLVFKDLGERLNISAGNVLLFNYSIFTDENRIELSENYTKEYTVKAVVDMNFKFDDNFKFGFVVNLEEYNRFYNVPNLTDCQNLIINFKHPENFYDVDDIQGTILKMRDFAVHIQNKIGLYNNYSMDNYGNVPVYDIDMPRVGILEIEQYVNIGMSIILLFVSILGVIISGVLINGILSTSVEEKIREFGIFRVLGSHRTFPIKLTVIQATILSIIGTGIGILLGYITVSTVLLPLIASLVHFTIGEVVPILSIQTISLSCSVGIGVSMLVGISPALKVSKMSILGAINPYRQESAGTRMVREGNINFKYILVGLIISGIAAFVLFAVPQILLTLDIGLITAVLIILLSTFLIGATLTGLGLIPLVQKVIWQILTVFSRKTKDIIRISLIRYSRRNTTTVIMFSISFAFVTLVATILGTQSNQNIENIRNRNGSDLVVDARRRFISGYVPDSSILIPDQNLAQELMAINGIVRTSTILASTQELDTIMGSHYSLTIYDLVKYKSAGVHGVAIDKNYLDTTYVEYCVMSQGDLTVAFEDLFNGSNTVIISTAIAMDLDVDLYDKILLSFEWSGEIQYIQFTIVGIADNMPGIPTVQKSTSGGMMGGETSAGSAVLLSQENFRKYFQLPAGNFPVSKIFIKLSQEYRNEDASKRIQKYIRKEYVDKRGYLLDMDNTFTQGSFARDIFSIVEVLFLSILTFAIIISLFGLTSSAYSTILERTREIGIIETLGLRKSKVANMFIIESEIIMISAALNGAIIGILLTALFYWQMSAFSSFPIWTAYEIPWDIITIELGIAFIACIISMKFLVRRIQKMELIEIFRTTL
ncbi:MAG: FtsX-like permease family protein [Promethearchaeota archaeon]